MGKLRRVSRRVRLLLLFLAFKVFAKLFYVQPIVHERIVRLGGESHPM